jgi:flagellar motor switch protein FliM
LKQVEQIQGGGDIVSEILSQSEIDALLSALQSGEVDVQAIKEDENNKRIRVYDFKRPNKFSKDQLNTIEAIYDNFCRLLTTYFSATLRSRIITKVASVDQVTYEEFVRSIPNPTILNIFSMPPLEGKGVLEINPVIGYGIIDRLFGGPGLSTIRGRPLTEIEKSVMERISEGILSLFRESWGSLSKIDAVLETIEINPQFAQIVAPLEMVVIITINIQIGDTEGFLNICLPCLMLEPISMKLNTRFWFTTSIPRVSVEDRTQQLKSIIEKTYLPVSAIIGKNTISVHEFLGLQIGDVITLEQSAGKDIEVFVGTRKKFLAKPGLIKNKIGMKITKVYQEGSEDDD